MWWSWCFVVDLSKYSLQDVYDVGGNSTNQTKIVLQHPNYQYINKYIMSKTFTLHLRWATMQQNIREQHHMFNIISLQWIQRAFIPQDQNNHYKKSWSI